MNQRIEVRSLVRKDGKVLLLKNEIGRAGVAGKYEIPGGRVELGEQPEEAIRRVIKNTTGLETQATYLSDVFTHVDSGDRSVQSAVILYATSVSGNKGDIQLAQKYSHYVWKKLAEIEESEVTELCYLLLNLHREKPSITTTVDGIKIRTDVDYSRAKKGVLALYSDGGSRGNPGPSAAGYVIKDADNQLVYEGGAYLGITTNNQAEYHGVRLGLEKAKELGAKSVECYVDSMLVINQLNGQYVIRNRELWPIHERIRELMGQFEKVTYRHVKREFNQDADGMVNRILDTRSKKESAKV